MRLCVDRLSTSWRKEREGRRGQTDSVAMPLPSAVPYHRLSPSPAVSALCLSAFCLVPCALGLSTPGAYPPASMNDRLAGQVGVGKYLGTFPLVGVAFEFCNAGIAKHDSAPHETADLGRAEQESAVTEHSRASIDRIRPSP